MNVWYVYVSVSVVYECVICVCECGYECGMRVSVVCVVYECGVCGI
jgi:hypothetical protein